MGLVRNIAIGLGVAGVAIALIELNNQGDTDASEEEGHVPEAVHTAYVMRDGFTFDGSAHLLSTGVNLPPIARIKYPVNFNVDSSTTGGSLSAFANAYYRATGKRVVFYPLAHGGTSLFSTAQWDPANADANYVRYVRDGLRLNLERLSLDFRFNEPRSKSVIWLQGESDHTQTQAAYAAKFEELATMMIGAGYDLFGIIVVGPHAVDLTAIRRAQRDVASRLPKAPVVFTHAEDFGADLMDDNVHYSLAGYDIVGKYAAENAATFLYPGAVPGSYPLPL